MHMWVAGSGHPPEHKTHGSLRVAAVADLGTNPTDRRVTRRLPLSTQRPLPADGRLETTWMGSREGDGRLAGGLGKAPRISIRHASASLFTVTYLPRYH